MKHRFLLDENLLHHAIRGVDEHDNPDLSAAELIRLIAENCHSITLNKFLCDRYWSHLKNMERERVRASALEPIFFVTQFMKNSAKWAWEHADPPDLPIGVSIPAEDVDVVRIALVSRSLFVTSDGELREAINNSPALHLRVLRPAEAVLLAQVS